MPILINIKHKRFNSFIPLTLCDLSPKSSVRHSLTRGTLIQSSKHVNGTRFYHLLLFAVRRITHRAITIIATAQPMHPVNHALMFLTGPCS